MEIKEAIKILKKCKSIYMTPNQCKALDSIIEAFWNGYTLCKVDEAVEKMRNMNTSERKESVWDSGEITADTAIERCVNIIKETCK